MPTSAQHADLVRALVDRQRKCVHDAEDRDQLRQEEQRDGDGEELVDRARLVVAVLVAGLHLDVGVVVADRGRGRRARVVEIDAVGDRRVRAVVEVRFGETPVEQRVGDQERRPPEQIALAVDPDHLDRDVAGREAEREPVPDLQSVLARFLVVDEHAVVTERTGTAGAHLEVERVGEPGAVHTHDPLVLVARHRPHRAEAEARGAPDLGQRGEAAHDVG